MKKADLKKVLKPIVKECIQEALLEEGLLSSVISEVVRGLNTQPIVEQQQIREVVETDTRIIEQEEEKRRKLQETRKKMLDAVSKDAYNGIDLFEGTTPLRQGGSAGTGTSPSGPLSDQDPSDSGVDITGLLGNNQRVWKSLMGGTEK